MAQKRILYASPFIPAEWIASFGLEPFRLFPASPAHPFSTGHSEGLCLFAQAFLHAAEAAAAEAAAVVFATTCDQMRRASEAFAGGAQAGQPAAPVFLFNVPATWQSASAHALYREELLRLGRFLVRLGGASPGPERLAEVMLGYDNARQALRSQRQDSSAREAAEALVSLYQTGPGNSALTAQHPPLSTQYSALSTPPRLALLGGPVLREQFGLYDEIERGGARVVLDATETGERTLPAPFDRARLQNDPLEELARAYFHHIPDAFRRPNERLYEWLATELSARGVQGILLLRCVWCDLWHAEVPRLKERIALPVLELEPERIAAEAPRTQVRLQALLEMFT